MLGRVRASNLKASTSNLIASASIRRLGCRFHSHQSNHSIHSEEILLIQRPARFSPKIIWACVGTLTLYAVVCAEACYNFESFESKSENLQDTHDKDDKLEEPDTPTPPWKRLLAGTAVCFIGLGAASLLLFNSSREVIRLSHLPKTDQLRLHTSLNLPISFGRGKKYAKLGKGVLVDAQSVSLREPKQSGQHRTLSAVPLSTNPPRLPFNIDRRFPWRVNVVPPQKQEGFYMDNKAFVDVFKKQWLNMIGR